MSGSSEEGSLKVGLHLEDLREEFNEIVLKILHAEEDEFEREIGGS